MTRPKRPIKESDVEAEVWYAGTDREIRGRALCDVGGTARVGFGVLELSPGCDTKPAHYHTLEEEHLYVLAGTGWLHLGDEVFRIGPGSYAHFPAGQAVPHYLRNDSDDVLRYIMVGERIADDEVVHAETT